jgi:hypothetical protein
MCRSSCVVNLASAVLLLLGAALVAAPFAARCSFATRYCKAWDGLSVADQTFYGLYVVGALFLLFGALGCCLAATGKKRYRFPFNVMLLALLLVVAVAAAWQADQGAALARLQTFRPGSLDTALGDLKSQLQRDLYHDFAVIYQGGDCRLDGKLECSECSVLEQVLNDCRTQWVPSPDAQTFLQSCTAELTGFERTCDGSCTEIFCQCAGVLQEDVQRNQQSVLYGLAGLLVLLLVVLLAACCVRRQAPDLYGDALLPARTPGLQLV